MKNRQLRYWLCQILGWGAWCLFGAYVNLVVYNDNFKGRYSNTPEQYEVVKEKFILALIVTFLIAILTTHTLRLILKKLNWLKYSFNNLVFTFFVSAISTGFVFYTLSEVVEKKGNLSLDDYRAKYKLLEAKEKEIAYGLQASNYYTKDSAAMTAAEQDAKKTILKTTGWQKNKNGTWQYRTNSDLIAIYQSIILIALWLLIYVVWHYVDRNRRDQMDKIRLETTVKELELKTIKAHINPHFIFNSLNSIRALVDEDPERARTAITALSNLLRSSMQADNIETVPLEKELKIVEDYLALEKIRFEDRLQVQLHIDEDTLDQQVPPMMVQTIVENAIKHGISKQINGGIIHIYSDFVSNHYELKIENTGILQPNTLNGFGVQSTQDRLKLLYGAKSSFAIIQANPTTVLVTVILPVKIN